GVTSTGKYHSLGESPLEYVYTPQAQTWRAGMSVVIRTANDPSAFIPSLRTEVTALDPTLPLSDVKTMESHLGIALLPSRIAGTALGVFGLLGLVLAAVGMYGVMAYSVSQRTREIGIRMAIGSTQGEVVRLVIRQGMKLVAIGSAVGLVGALGAARLARGLLYGGSASDPVTIGVVTLVLVSVALLAVWIPARRASRVDPILALRSE
ncbi:MAG: FtsX-like permease family protein, partial [Gemmatimonadaceae bacterium]